MILKDNAKRKNIKWAMLGVILVVAALSFFAYQLFSPNAKNDIDSYVESQNIPTKGGSGKDVKKVVVFTDYQCSHCVNFHNDVVDKHLKEKIAKNEISYSEVQFPVIDDKSDQYAQMSKGIAKESDTDYWRFSELGYEFATTDKDPMVTLERMDVSDKQKAKYEKYFKAHKSDKVDTKSLQDKFHVQQTPTVFVDGKMMSSEDEILKTLK